MPSEVFLPLVTAFVENAANCFGLGTDESLRLTLASEEVFMHLCRVVMPSGGPVEIVCSNGGYYAQAVFSLPTDAFDMRAFNLTVTISMEDDADLDAMGLVIASRSVDRFLLNREEGRDLRLTLIKEKTYPIPRRSPASVVGPLAKTSLRPPGPEEVKFLSQLAASYYDTRVLSDILLYPGKLVDMIRAGEYDCLAAVGNAGEIGGAIFWRRVGENTVECFGPYVFNQDPASNIAEELLEGCIGAVARTQSIGIINTRPTPEFSRRHFELLGTLDHYAPDGSCATGRSMVQAAARGHGLNGLGPSRARCVCSPGIRQAGPSKRDQDRSTVGRDFASAFRALRRVRPSSGACDIATDVAGRGCGRKYRTACQAFGRREDTQHPFRR